MSPLACCYVSGHGFGHASRVQAVVQALLGQPGWRVALRTPAPRRIFAWLLGPRCAFYPLELEPGVVQRDSFFHDALATAAAWQRTLAGAEAFIAAEARWLREQGCAVVLSDVSPLALGAAARAGVPGLALGNFTWDWILEAYLAKAPELAGVIARVAALYGEAQAYLRLPMSPETALFGRVHPVPLLARKPGRPGAETRAELVRRLGVDPGRELVLVSFGGFGVEQLDLGAAARHPELLCLWDRPEEAPPQLRSVAALGLHYPDLIAAADLTLTKPGYSIIAESVAGRTPLAYASRPGFRESALLEEYLQRTWPSLRLDRAALADGSWAAAVARFCAEPHPTPRLATDGAAEVVRLLQAYAR